MSLVYADDTATVSLPGKTNDYLTGILDICVHLVYGSDVFDKLKLKRDLLNHVVVPIADICKVTSASNIAESLTSGPYNEQAVQMV